MNPFRIVGKDFFIPTQEIGLSPVTIMVQKERISLLIKQQK